MKKALLFAVTTLASVAVFAQDAGATGGHGGMVAIAAAIAIGLAVFGGTSAQGKAASAAIYSANFIFSSYRVFSYLSVPSCFHQNSSS
jgi:hypothetical protein